MRNRKRQHCFNQQHTLSLTAHAIFPPKSGGDEMNFTWVFVSCHRPLPEKTLGPRLVTYLILKLHTGKLLPPATSRPHGKACGGGSKWLPYRRPLIGSFRNETFLKANRNNDFCYVETWRTRFFFQVKLARSCGKGAHKSVHFALKNPELATLHITQERQNVLFQKSPSSKIFQTHDLLNSWITHE